VPEATETPALESVLARNIAARRAAMGWSQAALARAMAFVGVAWTQSTVALVETERRQVRAVESVALSVVLRTTLAALLAPGDDELVKVGDIRWRASIVCKVATDDLGDNFDEAIADDIYSTPADLPDTMREIESGFAAAQAFADRWGLSAVALPTVIGSAGSAEREASSRIRRQARRTGIRLQTQPSPLDVAAAAFRLWQSSYDAERERRVSERVAAGASDRSRQAARGHVARKLDRELLDEMVSVLGTAPTTNRKGNRK
jgi:transcriptional regulator with XRE-family HTH domain